ncbi:MAG: hypothetical protein WBG46_06350 [Nonlabens sp.]
MSNSAKVQTALRLDKNLLEVLKEKAKASNRSLNNYIETLLFKEVGRVPNHTTVKAIHDARSDNTETIADLDRWLDSI